MIKYCVRSIIVAVLLLLSLSAQAEEWSTEDQLWGALAGTLLVMDYGTTRNIVNRPTEYHEMNPVLGQHPSMAQVNLHFLVAGAGIFAAANYFPEYRREILMVTSAVELLVVGNNLRIGLRVQY